MLLLDVDEEDAVAARTVLVHVYIKKENNKLVGEKKRFPAVLELYTYKMALN